MNTLVAISLFATACIDGTLHGQPQMLCHEFQIRRGYENVEACTKTAGQTVAEWLNGLHMIGIDARLAPVGAYRCGPEEPDGDDI